MNPIDLGTKGGSEVCCGPPTPSGTSVYYPSTYITLPESANAEIPESGEITFRFRVTRETEDRKDMTCRYEIDLEQITNVKPDPEKSDEDDNASERITKAFAGKKKY